MDRIGLVLQGGGFRGIYTAGVLDYFLTQKIYFPYIIGVSAGACNGIAYVAKEIGFGKKMYTKYIFDHRYMGFNHLWKNGSYFNMDFILDEIPGKLEHFDFGAFYQAKEELVVGTTDCSTGKPVYFSKSSYRQITKAIQASISLPFLSKMVELEGRRLLDGGICDPIPIRKSMEDGNTKNVIVLTKPLEYLEKSIVISYLASIMYRNHGALCQLLHNGHSIYNGTIDEIQRLKTERQVWVIAPSRVRGIGTIGKDLTNLESLYLTGYNDARNACDGLMKWATS